jgi:transcription elongation factor Elf1
LSLQECPYCNLPGLVTTMKASAGGFEVTGKCITCGYSYDSEYDPSEITEDLLGDYSRQLEAAAAD